MSVATHLITGFPAQRARAVLRAVQDREPETDVVLLVHPDRFAEAEALLAGASDVDRARPRVLQGDATAIDFGLSRSDYLELTRRVAVVHGVYSVTDGNVSENQAERVNVGAARELIEFARAAGPATGIVFYSSVFVSGNRSGVVAESDLEAGQSFRNPVERTLAVAERMLRRSSLPVSVLRAGHLLGDSVTGAIEHLSGPYPMMVVIASAPEHVMLPLPPRAEAPLPLTPVDYLGELGAFLGQKRDFGRTVHALDPERLNLKRFLELCAECSGKRLEWRFNPGAVTRALIGNPSARLLPQNARGIFEVLTTSAEYTIAVTNELVARGGPTCPPVTSTLDRLLAHVRERIENGTLVSGRRPAPFLVS